MKKLTSILLALLMALTLLPTAVFADTALTGMGTETDPYVVSSDTDLRAAVEKGGYIKLSGNVVLTKPVEVDKTVVLDLGGKSITPASDYAEIGDGTNAYKDSLISVKRGGNLTVNDSVGSGLISTGNNSSIFGAIKMTIRGEAASGTEAVLTVNGGTIEGYYYAITGNGGRHNTKITVNGGTIKGLNSVDSLAIHQPQGGILIINGGTLEGNTTLGIKSGTLTITDGTFIATGEKKAYTHNGNGFEMTGDALVVEACDYPGGLPVVVDISGGTFTSTNGSAVAYYQHTKADGTKYAIDDDKFITGGVFSTDVKDFVDNDAVVTAISGDTYIVGTEMVKAAAQSLASGDTLTITQGSVDLTGVAVGVTVKNNGNGTVKVNNVTLTDSYKESGYTVPAKRVWRDTSATVTDKAESPKTFDAGVAIYGVMAVSSVLGMGYMGKKKFF